jgi:hydrogenase-4 component F
VVADTPLRNLNWSEIMRVSGRLDKNILKVSFLFILIGFGTKAGFAPMHTWLPDAHSQAPAPISALLSGVLLKTAIYGILRFMMIVNSAAGPGYTQHLLLIFGMISLGVAAAFIILQKDLKRLLAYHSVEHMGLLCIGIGFGGAGLFGMLLHTLNHAVTKALMFCGAGTVVRKYRTTNMHSIRGVIRVMPFTGVILILGAFALGGMPPFSIFTSELIILFGGYSGGHFVLATVTLLFLAVIFAGIITHFSQMVFGRNQEEVQKEKEGWFEISSFIILFFVMTLLGIFIPSGFQGLLSSIAGLININGNTVTHGL